MIHHSENCSSLNLNLCLCSVIFDTCSLLFCASLFASIRLDAVLNPNFGHNLSESSIFFYSLRARTESLKTKLEDFQLYSKIALYDTCFVPRYHFSPIFFCHFFFFFVLPPPPCFHSYEHLIKSVLLTF